MKNLEIRRVGDELAVILPKEWIDQAELGEGDELVARISEGTLSLATTDGRHEWLMSLAREGMDEYREALAELANMTRPDLAIPRDVSTTLDLSDGSRWPALEVGDLSFDLLRDTGQRKAWKCLLTGHDSGTALAIAVQT